MTAFLRETTETSDARCCPADVFYSNETAGKIQTGIDSFRRGEGKPADEVFAELRKQYGL